MRGFGWWLYFDGSGGFLVNLFAVAFRAEIGEVAARRFSEMALVVFEKCRYFWTGQFFP